MSPVNATVIGFGGGGGVGDGVGLGDGDCDAALLLEGPAALVGDPPRWSSRPR